MATNVYPLSVENGGLHSTNTPTMSLDQDTNLAKWAVSFPHGSETRLHYSFYVPSNYLSGTLTVRLRWRSASTSGNVVWKTYGRCSSGALGSFASATGTVTTAVSGSANTLTESVISFTPSNFAASIDCDITVARDGANGSDTCTGSAEIEEINFEYTVDGTVPRGYLWIPPPSFAIPASSSVTLGAPVAATDTATIQPRVLAFPDTSTPIADARFTLPSNFSANLKTNLVFSTGTNGGSVGWHIDMGAASVGSTADPSLTSQGTFTVTTGSTSTKYKDAQRAGIITASTGQEICLRLTRDTTDANTGTVYCYGLMLEYDILSKQPCSNRLDPGSAAQPTGVTAANILKQDDTNTTKFIAQYTASVESCLDWVTMVPSLYGMGGTLRVRWRSSASSGTVRWRADYGSPASGAASDPALTTGTVTSSATTGANVINELTLDVSSGIVASDMVHIRLWRKGTDGADTLAATVDLLDVVLETNPA